MKNSILNNIQIVLCNTSHPGNIGSAARAMKTMGIYNLTLVAPIAQPDDHAIALSCNAHDVVKNCKIITTLEEAIADSHLVFAMTGRKREFNKMLQTPKQIIPELFSALQTNAKISIVFGNEQSGLTIEQIERCNRLVTLPGNPEYFSLNLAQAVQTVCYEIYSNYNPDVSFLQNPVTLATEQDTQHLLKKLDAIMTQLDMYKAKNPERTLRRLQYILHKANLEREDVDLLSGILKKISTSLPN